MLFSVIIPTFNRRDLLHRTLESVWQQTFTNLEVIVVDDGSTDDTAPYLESIGNRIQYLHQENKGPGPARNLGVSRARGDYVAFLDSDDIWFPWTLETFALLIRDHKFPSIVSSRLMEFHDETELTGVRNEPVRAEAFPDYFASSKAGYFVGAGMAVLRRDQLLKTGGFTEQRMNAEDHDLILRMGIAPGFVQTMQPVTLAWRRHSSSATQDLQRTYEGSRYLIQQEVRGAYPGGTERKRDRQRILTRHVRPAALNCLRNKMKKEAWELYRATFRWHARLGRWKYLAGFALKASIARA